MGECSRLTAKEKQSQKHPFFDVVDIFGIPHSDQVFRSPQLKTFGWVTVFTAICCLHGSSRKTTGVTEHPRHLKEKHLLSTLPKSAFLPSGSWNSSIFLHLPALRVGISAPKTTKKPNIFALSEFTKVSVRKHLWPHDPPRSTCTPQKGTQTSFIPELPAIRRVTMSPFVAEQNKGPRGSIPFEI